MHPLHPCWIRPCMDLHPFWLEMCLNFFVNSCGMQIFMEIYTVYTAKQSRGSETEETLRTRCKRSLILIPFLLLSLYRRLMHKRKQGLSIIVSIVFALDKIFKQETHIISFSKFFFTLKTIGAIPHFVQNQSLQNPVFC